MKIITIGGATQDIFIKHQHMQSLTLNDEARAQTYLIYPQGEKIEVRDLEYHTGGGATNSAVSFKRLGWDVQSCFKIGNDCQAEFIIDHIKRYDIDISSLMQTTEHPSGTSFILPAKTGDSTILAFRGSNATIEESEFPFHIIKKETPLYITSLSGKSADVLLPITKKAKENNCIVATNPGTSQLIYSGHILFKSLPYIDILILNSKEARTFMLSLVETDKHTHHMMHQKHQQENSKAPRLLQALVHYENTSFNISDYFSRINSYGPYLIVVTNGAEGVYVYHEKKIYFCPSLPTTIVNTVGAGDAFGSCFVSSILQGNSISQSLINGITNSASVLGFISAKEGLLTSSQLHDKAQKQAIKNVQIFDVR